MKKLYLPLFFLGLAGLILSIFQIAGLKRSDCATFVGLLAAAIVWWQAHLIKEQMQLQAIIELEKEWNSPQMLKKRSAAWNQQNKVGKENVDAVLEFLEKVSTFEKRGVISADLIWDTFGWYLWRYYYYCSNVIDELREDWTNKSDRTLYGDIQDLWPKLLKREIQNRNRKKGTGPADISEDDAIAELEKTREKFIKSERSLSS